MLGQKLRYFLIHCVDGRVLFAALAAAGVRHSEKCSNLPERNLPGSAFSCERKRMKTPGVASHPAPRMCVAQRLAARPKVKVSTAGIVVAPWRSPVRSISRTLAESRRDFVVAVLAVVPPMGVGLRRGGKRANRDCRACDCRADEKTKGSVHHYSFG